jgi:hypothetical protein
MGRMHSSVIYTNPVRTSQETHYVSATKPELLMLFRKMIAVYFDMRHINTLCVGECISSNIKRGGGYSYHYALKGNKI